MPPLLFTLSGVRLRWTGVTMSPLKTYRTPFLFLLGTLVWGMPGPLFPLWVAFIICIFCQKTGPVVVRALLQLPGAGSRSPKLPLVVHALPGGAH